MKLTLSKSNDPRGKHLVVVCTNDEYREILPVLKEEICPDRNIPVERARETDEVRLRFHISFLERLRLGLPFASLSRGIENMMLEQEMERHRTMEVPEFDIPGIQRPLWDHQKIMAKAISDGIDKHGYFLDNDAMGLGKTATIIATVVKKQLFPCLIAVGSVSGKYVWENEIRTLFPDVSVTVVDGNAQQRAKLINEGSDFTIVNIQALRIKTEFDRHTQKSKVVKVSNPDIFEIDWECFVADEYHKCKNPSAQQTIGFLALECGAFIGASGTPILNKPEEAWPFLNKCDNGNFPTFYSFEQAIGKHSSRTGKIIGYKPSEMLKVRRWLDEHSLRRRPEHVSDSLPEVLRYDHLVELTDEQRKLYDKIRDEMLMGMEDGTVRTIAHVLTQVLRLKQACFSPELYGGSKVSGKIDQIKEDVAELVASGEKAIIFSEWAQATRILQRELAEYNPAYVDGSVSAKNRVAEEYRFNNDPDCHLYIGTIRANQEAITLAAAGYVLFADEEWTPMANAQAEARSAAGGMRGLGRDKPVQIIRYQAEDTIEQRLAGKLYRKRKTFDAMVERDGGTSLRKTTIKSLAELL